MKNTIAILLLLAGTVTVFAQWQLIDNFEQWSNLGEWVVLEDASEIGWHTICEQGNDDYLVWPEYYDSSNHWLAIESYVVSSLSAAFVSKALVGEGVAPGNTGTLFFRCLWDSFRGSWYIGVTDVEIAYDNSSGTQISPGEFGAFNASIRISRNGEIEHRDGDQYVPAGSSGILELGQWYNFWIVVENSWDHTPTPSSSTGKFTLYVQGPGIGDGISPTLIPVGTTPARETATFRRIPADIEGNPRAIQNILIATNHGFPPSGISTRHYYDDFYYSEGRNLTVPPITGNYQMYSEWFVGNGGGTSTGDFLHYIYVDQAPYIWVSSLGGWIYMEEQTIRPEGAWAYIFK